MKTSHFFYFLLAVVLFSCNEGNYNQDIPDIGLQEDANYEYEDLEDGSGNTYAMNNDQTQSYASQNSTSTQNSDGRGTKNYQFIDTKLNLTMGTMPVPSDWNKSNDPQAILEGPNGIKVFKEKGNFYTWGNDPTLNQVGQEIGQNVKQPMSVENLIQQELVPFVQQQGAQFVKQYSIEQLTRFDEAYYAKLWQYAPMQRRFSVMAAEFKGNNGKSSIVVVHHQIGQDQMGIIWGYTLSMMEANHSSFETAKQAFINGLINVQINPQWIQAKNQDEQQLAYHRDAKNKVKIAQIKAFGEANTARYKANRTASDARHNNYMERQAASDASHSAYVDGIWDRRNMTDNNGNTYKVEGYDNNVWVNQNNEVIGTDNYNWNPNTENTTNNDTWNQLQSTDDGG